MYTLLEEVQTYWRQKDALSHLSQILLIVHMIQANLQECIYFCTYVHYNIRVLCLVVVTQVILHSVPGHQAMPSVHIKLINTNSNACTPPGCAIGLLVTSKNVEFHCWSPVQSLWCPRDVMHPSTNTDPCTHSCGWYGPSGGQTDMFCGRSQSSPGSL